MTRDEAMWWVNHLFEIRKEEYFNKGMMKDAKEVEEAQTMAIEALQTEGENGEGVVAYVCDNRKCGGDCDNCGRTTDIAHAKNFTRISDSYFERLDSVSVVRCKDCRHKVVTKDGEYNEEDIVCDYWLSDGLDSNDFCSMGERQ